MMPVPVCCVLLLVFHGDPCVFCAADVVLRCFVGFPCDLLVSMLSLQIVEDCVYSD
jgi:hypothetical protein